MSRKIDGKCRCGFALALVGVLVGLASSVTGAEPSAEAKTAAVKAHEKAAAVDKLPRFCVRARVETRSGIVMDDAPDDPLECLMRVLNDPMGDGECYRHQPVFAWDEDHFLSGNMKDRGGGEKPKSGPASLDLRNGSYRWGTRTRSGHCIRPNGPTSHVLRADAAAMWADLVLDPPNYTLITRHDFWWGNTGGDSFKHIGGNNLPPSRSDYYLLPPEPFDGHPCDVVESPTRQERLWIDKKTGVIRGYVDFDVRGGPADFHRSEAVREATGRTFKTHREYATWYLAEYYSLPDEKKDALSMAWVRSCDWSTARPVLIVRFRDFREIAPGIWWPYREDRVDGHLKDNRFECMRMVCTIDEIRTNLDLAETVKSLQPKKGERVQDQRFGIAVNYEFDPNRTEAEIMEMVDAALQKQMESRAIIARYKKPFDDMVGKPAPKLPEDGWVGGPRPDVAGKPYLIHCWAVWCGPCKNDFARLKELAEQGATIVGLHPANASAEDVRKVLEEKKLGYATYVSSKAGSGGADRIAGYPVTMYPYYILVDPKGKVATHGWLHERNGDLLTRLNQYRREIAKQRNER